MCNCTYGSFVFDDRAEILPGISGLAKINGLGDERLQFTRSFSADEKFGLTSQMRGDREIVEWIGQVSFN